MTKKLLPLVLLPLGLLLLASCGNPASGEPADGATTYSKAPTVVSAKFSDGTKVDNAANVAPTVTYMEIAFDQDMETGWSIKRNEKSLTFGCQWIDSRTARVTFTSELCRGLTYNLILNPVGCTTPFRNVSGLKLEPMTLSFTIAPYTTAPTIVSVKFPDGTEARDATNVSPAEAYMDIVFDQTMSTDRAIGWNEQDLAATVAWIDNRTLRVNFPNGLSQGFNYKFTLNPAEGTYRFRNTSGIVLVLTVIPFTVASDPDAPTIVSAKFPDGTDARDATDVATTIAYMDIAFDQAMSTDCRLGWNEEFFTADTQWVDDKTFRITFTSGLSQGFRYNFTFNSSSGTYPPFKNKAGSKLAATTISFTVIPYTTAPGIVSATFSNGASAIDGTNIPSNVTYMDVVFDQRMSNGCSNGSNDEQLTGMTATWQDFTTIRIGFPNGLASNYSYKIFLNMTDHRNYMNTSDIALPDTTLSFSTAP